MKPDQSNGDQQLQLAERVAYLIAGFLKNNLTTEEHDELDAWVEESDDNMRLFEELTDENYLKAAIGWHKNLEQENALDKLKKALGLGVKTRSFLHSFWPYAITACLLLAATGIYLYNKTWNKPLAKTNVENKTDVRAGGDHAVLILAGGRTIILDSTGTGLLANEGSVSILKGNKGEIIYEGKAKEMKYNTVSTPRGGQYKLVLGDGTRVWLNAESSIKFPAGFETSQRDVEIKGEAYFEVAKNPASPFRVHILTDNGDGGVVEVLGTHFNINSYNDEGVVKTTLLEGSVRITKGNQQVMLKPGQQARTGSTISVVPADAESELAWKDGLFLFRGTSIENITAQITRWYDVDAEIRGKIDYHFYATIDRSEPLSSFIKYLEATKRVHIKQEGKKLLIEP